MLNVAVLDNPSPFGNPFQFEITFECMEDLPEGWYSFQLTLTCNANYIMFCYMLAMGNSYLSSFCLYVNLYFEEGK